MDQIKQYWSLLQEKMDEDPIIKKAVIGGGIALAAIVLMLGVKAFKDSTPDAPALPDAVVQAPVDSQTAAAVQPAVVQPAAAQAAAPVVAVQQLTSPQQIVSAAVKPLSAFASMQPGFVMSYSYAGGSDIEDQSLFALVADVIYDTPTLQFLAKPDEALNNQIVPGNVVIQTKAKGYFVVEQQSSPLLNVLISGGGETGRVQVYIDDQVVPVIDNKHSRYGSSNQYSLPIMQTYAAGLHRVTVVVTAEYSKRDLKTSVRLSIKRNTDPAPVDLQVYKDAPTPVLAAPVQPVAPSVTTAPVSTTTTSAAPTAAPVTKAGGV